MGSEAITKSNTDTEILRFDVLDELLERDAKAEQSASLWHFALAIRTTEAYRTPRAKDWGEMAQQSP